MSDSILAELRRRYPGKGRAADHENGRAAAVWLFCVHCQGGDRNAAVVRDEGVVPTVEEYRALTDSSGDGGEALRKWRESAA